VLLVLLAACDQPEELPVEPVSAPDGVLDCGSDLHIVSVQDFFGQTAGHSTPRQAVMAAASEFMSPGDGVIEIDTITFSIVRDGREVVIFHVEGLESGRFLAPSTEACSGEWPT
jgi:hypothetical protein